MFSPCLTAVFALLLLLWLQVYGLLRDNLSKFLLAVTVDDPASIPPPKNETETETNTEPQTKTAEAKASDGDGTPPEADAAATSTTGENGGDGDGAGDGDGGDGKKNSPEEKNNNNKKPDEGEKDGDTVEAAEATTGKTAEQEEAAAIQKPGPNGPKCVQLKMRPDWWRRAGGGNKRRRGDLDRGGAGGGRGGGGHWAWPEGRPEFCRFVLYKENSDTVRWWYLGFS